MGRRTDIKSRFVEIRAASIRLLTYHYDAERRSMAKTKYEALDVYGARAVI